MTRKYCNYVGPFQYISWKIRSIPRFYLGMDCYCKCIAHDKEIIMLVHSIYYVIWKRGPVQDVTWTWRVRCMAHISVEKDNRTIPRCYLDNKGPFQDVTWTWTRIVGCMAHASEGMEEWCRTIKWTKRPILRYNVGPFQDVGQKGPFQDVTWTGRVGCMAHVYADPLGYLVSLNYGIPGALPQKRTKYVSAQIQNSIFLTASQKPLAIFL